MVEPHLSSCLQDLLVLFAPCFTRPSFQSFAILTTGWISCIGRHSIARMIQASGSLSQSKHHSSLYRFLSHGAWSVDDISFTLFQLLLPLLHKEIFLIIDDTLCSKTGPHIFGAAMHFDASRSTYGRGSSQGAKKFFAFGHNWVVAALWLPLPWAPHRGMAVPFMFRLCRSPKHCPADLHRVRTLLAAEMIRLIVAWLPNNRRLHLLADGEYACKNVVRSLPRNVIFTGPMVMDAALFDLPGPQKKRGRPRIKGQQLPSPKLLARDSSKPWTDVTLNIYGRQVTILVKSQRCLWYTVAGLRLVTMIVTRDPAQRLDDRAFFSTDEQISVQDLIAAYARRWDIEVSFRNLKQHMGLHHPQNGWWRRLLREPRPRKKPGPDPHPSKGQSAINHTMALSFVSYALVIVWYLRHADPVADVARVKREAPWYRHKATPSFSDMLAALRRHLWLSFSRDPAAKRLDENSADALPLWILAA